MTAANLAAKYFFLSIFAAEGASADADAADAAAADAADAAASLQSQLMLRQLQVPYFQRGLTAKYFLS